MPLINDIEIHYVKANPLRPNGTYNKENPTWEVQLRTKDRAVREELLEMSLKPVAVRVDPKDEESAVDYWRVNLRKKSIKEKDGTAADPVKVIDGDLEPVDPDTIGNGSRANVRIYQYAYENDGKKGLASVLMGIQLTEHILYEPKPHDDDFAKTETKRIKPVVDPDDGAAEEDSTSDSSKLSPTPKPPAGDEF
jgi:hypothetical protein